MKPTDHQSLFEAYLHAKRSLIFESSTRIARDLALLAQSAAEYAAANPVTIPAAFVEDMDDFIIDAETE